MPTFVEFIAPSFCRVSPSQCVDLAMPTSLKLTAAAEARRWHNSPRMYILICTRQCQYSVIVLSILSSVEDFAFIGRALVPTRCRNMFPRNADLQICAPGYADVPIRLGRAEPWIRNAIPHRTIRSSTTRHRRPKHHRIRLTYSS